jgi:hypothetical protein
MNSSMNASGCFRSTIVLTILSTAMMVASSAHADVVTLSDGRQFEGLVRSDQGDTIRFETVVSDTRVTIEFKRSDVKSVDRKPVPDELFESAAGEHRIAPPPASQQATTLYLEIPIVGRFRETVFVQAIRSTLAYAKKKGINHIVFNVDSDGGAVEDAGAVYKTLTEFAGTLHYHAVIRKCLNDAIVIPFLCETVHLLPDAVIGGTSQKMENLPRKFGTKDEQLVRSQIAGDLYDAARKRGRDGRLIRAMIDPEQPLAAWIDDKRDLAMGTAPPQNITPDRVIFQVGPGSVLQLTFDQARRLGVPTITGGADRLGHELNLPGWREESSYGRDAMNRVIAGRKRAASSAQAKYEDKLTQNIRMRETASRAIEVNIKQAAQWNPTSDSYSKLSAYWGWELGLDFDIQLWTPESRARWRDRSDACLYFLTKAQDNIKLMIRLDKEAVPMGLSPTFKADDLAYMLEDVSMKVQMLARHRNRAGD